jgi:hypothetical protein
VLRRRLRDGKESPHRKGKIAKEVQERFGPNSLRCLSPTGVAAENLLPGTLTIHRGLCIDPNYKNLEPLKGERLDTFCARYAGTFVFVIDEISMVGAVVFAKISLRLRQLASQRGGGSLA